MVKFWIRMYDVKIYTKSTQCPSHTLKCVYACKCFDTKLGSLKEDGHIYDTQGNNQHLPRDLRTMSTVSRQRRFRNPDLPPQPAANFVVLLIKLSENYTDLLICFGKKRPCVTVVRSLIWIYFIFAFRNVGDITR